MFIGNVRLGVTPRSGFKLVAQAAGTISCTIRKEGYVTVERSVTIEPGASQPLVLRIRLEPAPAAPLAAAAPPDAAKARTGPPAPRKTAAAPTATATSSGPSKQGSHKGLILGAAGSAAAAGAGVAVASKRNGAAPAALPGPSAATLSGTYSGTVQDSRGGGGPVTLTLTHSTSYVTGTWHGPEPVWRALNGTVSGGAIAATLLPSLNTACPYSLAAHAAGNRITGTFTSFNCPVPVSGTVDLTRQ